MKSCNFKAGVPKLRGRRWMLWLSVILVPLAIIGVSSGVFFVSLSNTLLAVLTLGSGVFGLLINVIILYMFAWTSSCSIKFTASGKAFISYVDEKTGLRHKDNVAKFVSAVNYPRGLVVKYTDEAGDVKSVMLCGRFKSEDMESMKSVFAELEKNSLKRETDDIEKELEKDA